eukprot:750378-Hanusia_phi.AAC.1
MELDKEGGSSWVYSTRSLPGLQTVELAQEQCNDNVTDCLITQNEGQRQAEQLDGSNATFAAPQGRSPRGSYTPALFLYLLPQTVVKMRQSSSRDPLLRSRGSVSPDSRFPVSPGPGPRLNINFKRADATPHPLAAANGFRTRPSLPQAQHNPGRSSAMADRRAPELMALALKESFKIDLRSSLPLVHEKSEKEQVFQAQVSAPPPQRYSRQGRRQENDDGQEGRGNNEEQRRRNRNRQVGFELIRNMEARRPIPFLVFMMSRDNPTLVPSG